MDSTLFTAIDLFAGIGGFRLGVEECGGKCIAFSEINEDAISTYTHNFGSNDGSDNLGDIRNIQYLPPHDLLCGGVPCQPWSIAGDNLGFEDDRGMLWYNTISLLEKYKPKVFLFENVKGLVDPRNRQSFEILLSQFEKYGYYVKYKLLTSQNYGNVQNRERVFLVGFLDKKYFDSFEFPKPTTNANSKVVRVGDILNLEYNISDAPQAYSLNDVRGGDNTIHSWDLMEIDKKYITICETIMKNRRKPIYGKQDGNPMSLDHLRSLLANIMVINEDMLNHLVDINILDKIEYKFKLTGGEVIRKDYLTDSETYVLFKHIWHCNGLDAMKGDIYFKQNKVRLESILDSLKNKRIIECSEYRYDLKNRKISTGINGIGRIIMPHSFEYPTITASDTSDFICVDGKDITSKSDMVKLILSNPNAIRKISKIETLLLQDFPTNFNISDKRNKYVKLIGNSVSPNVVKHIIKEIVKTNVFL